MKDAYESPISHMGISSSDKASLSNFGREEDLPDNVIKFQQAVMIASIRIMAGLRETNDTPPR